MKQEAVLAKLVSVLAALAAIAAFGATSLKAADDYPNRPIVLVIPLPPGGTNDIMARAVSDKMSAALGQRIVIENRNAGGSGTVGTREVAHAAPDGYTIILGYTSTLATGPHLYKNVGYDPRKDLAPIGLIASAPALLLVYKDLPVHNVGELIALMKSAKEPFQVATPGAGTVNFLASILFAQQAGVNVEQIIEKGSGPLVTDMMGGFRQGRLQSDPGVACRSRRRLYPRSGGDLRQAFDADAESADARRIRPAGLRCDLELRLAGAGRHAAADRAKAEQGAATTALADDAVRKRIINEGAEPEPGTPAEQAAVIDHEETKWAAVIRSAHLQPK